MMVFPSDWRGRLGTSLAPTRGLPGGRRACCRTCRQAPDCAACDRNVPGSRRPVGTSAGMDHGPWKPPSRRAAAGPPRSSWNGRARLGLRWQATGCRVAVCPPRSSWGGHARLGPRCEPSIRRMVGLPRSGWDGHARPGPPNCGRFVPEFQSLAASVRYAQWLTATDRPTGARPAARFAAIRGAAICGSHARGGHLRSHAWRGHLRRHARSGHARRSHRRGIGVHHPARSPELSVSCGRRNPAREDYKCCDANA